MHQPIQWYEWGREPFDKAKLENKPILLDIGAVWCHWCHVMDRESYEDPEIAQIINERFIAIKVDRDERPDIDSRYQVAVQAISGQGGWPLTGFLTPDGRPFYGGTYFPPHDHYARPSFGRVLLAISDAYRDKNADVIEQAKLVEAALSHSESFAEKPEIFHPRAIQQIIDSALKMFDEAHGGFGTAPKFPHPSILDLLTDQSMRSRDERLRHVVTFTLEQMARGGVYDQLAGGFHRYSVDERWIVPHFEKMSYDNSELLKNYVHAYQSTGNPFFADVARDIIGWMDEWLTDCEHGGFYASQDADFSMDDDGDYFTWTLDEARSVLSADEAQVACLHYDINEIGEMHHNPAKNVLYQRASLEEIAVRLNLPSERVKRLLDSARRKMYSARLNRPTPYIDKTIYVNWNALCISAYLRAASVLAIADARGSALRALDRILAEAWEPESGLKHVVAYSNAATGKSNDEGFLEDYAFTVNACLDAYEATADMAYFRKAQQISERMIGQFYDVNTAGFFDRAQIPGLPGALSVPRKPFQDSPTPAGNPAAAIALLRLHAYTGDQSYREKATGTLALLSNTAGEYGLFAATYAIAAVYASQPHTQVVILGEDETASELYSEALSSGVIGRSVIKLKFNQAVAQNLPPALASTIPAVPAIKTGSTTAVVCSGFSCRPPVETASELRRLLSEQDAAA
jgi:uncharacterized protein YyaL (SSP411 family)